MQYLSQNPVFATLFWKSVSVQRDIFDIQRQENFHDILVSCPV
jgi:hypothetical protein